MLTASWSFAELHQRFSSCWEPELVRLQLQPCSWKGQVLAAQDVLFDRGDVKKEKGPGSSELILRCFEGSVHSLYRKRLEVRRIRWDTHEVAHSDLSEKLL